MTDAAEKLLAGAIDTHVHTAPDVRPRKGDDLQIVERARDAGMKAVVLKSHHDPTAGRAQLMQKLFPEIRVFGGTVLNYSCGGLNPQAVDTAAKLGGKVIWMPTNSAANHLAHAGGNISRQAPLQDGQNQGIKIVDEAGKLLPEVRTILEIIEANRLILATGHLSVPETRLLVAESRKMGVKIIITHPELPLTSPSLAEQKELAAMGAYFERCFIVTKLSPGIPIIRIIEAIRAVGPQSTIMATDLGQANNPWPADGMLEYIEGMLQNGVTPAEIDLMVKSNPARLLEL